MNTCSDHFPYSVTVQAIVENHQVRSSPTFSYSSEKIKLLNHAILKNRFRPVCYSKIDVFLSSWNEWLHSLASKVIPMKTKHRQNLPPWKKPETSNMIKRLHTAREHKLTKVAVLERELSSKLNENQVVYESKLLETKNFSNFYRYLRAVRRPSQVPPIVRW